MKKIWILTVVSIVSLFLFTACASEADTMVSPSPSTAPAQTMPPAGTDAPSGIDQPLGSGGATSSDMGGAGMNGTGMNGTGMTGNAGSGTTGVTPTGVTTMEDSRRVSERVEEEVEKLSELDEAEAIVVDDMAVVGVKYDSQYRSGMDDRLKKMIEARVQAVDKSITKVYVVESAGDMDMLGKIRQKLTDANFTLEQLRTELMGLTGKMQG